MKNNANLVLELIRFQFYSKNIIEFFNYYKIYLQKRLLNNSDISKEEIFIKEISNFFDKKYLKYFDLIENCLKDFKISQIINKEFTNLEVVIKNEEYKDIDFNLKKIKLSMFSGVLWSEFKSTKISSKPNIPKNISIYTSLIQKYYNQKYENRKMNVSHDQSNISIKIKDLTIKMPLSYYYVISYVLDAEKNNDLIFEKLNMSKDIINEILAISVHMIF